MVHNPGNPFRGNDIERRALDGVTTLVGWTADEACELHRLHWQDHTQPGRG